MLFSSITFLFYFLPFVFVISLLIRTNKWRNLFLLFASLVFFMWGEPEMLFLLLICICINYTGAIIIDRQNNQRRRKWSMILCVLFNVGLLGYFKYYNFFVGNINSVFGTSFDIRRIILPIGISFYTFHNLSYVVDVYKRKIKAQNHLVNLALYISFFPQLIAGPIVRYVDIADQLYHRIITSALVASGIRRFITGLAKKLILANNFAWVADKMFGLPVEQYHFTSSWLGIIAYTLQIYFDFSGYSDMAIGLGRMFGFRFLENFNFPYISRSMQEFWRRWHISLSSWFRDYVYIPLGGNRVSVWRVYFNLCVVFFCTGFWHGASWNFIVWGMAHGFFQIVERLGWANVLERLPRIAGHIYTLLVVIFTWVLFRADNLNEAILYMGSMIGIHSGDASLFNIYRYIDWYNTLLFIAGMVLCVPYHNVKIRMVTNLNRISARFVRIGGYQFINLGYGLLLIYSIMTVASGTYNPFIYFRF